MMPNSGDDFRLLEAVRKYEQIYRHPDRPAFDVSEPMSAGDKDVKGDWEGTGASFRAGCYVLFSAMGALLYVGKASHGRTVGNRLVRFRYQGSGWVEPPAYVRIIVVSEAFEAPSLEEFLIRELRPPVNKQGAEQLA